MVQGRGRTMDGGKVMAKKNVPAIISATGFIATFYTSLWNAVQELGGTEPDIYRLNRPRGVSLIQQFARSIVQEAGKYYPVTDNPRLSFVEKLLRAKLDVFPEQFSLHSGGFEGDVGTSGEIFLFEFEQRKYEYEIVEEMKKFGFKSANSVDSLNFIAQHPDALKDGPIVFLGDLWPPNDILFHSAVKLSLETDGSKVLETMWQDAIWEPGWRYAAMYPSE